MFLKKLNTKALKAFFIYAVILCLFSVGSLIALTVLKNRNVYIVLIRLFTSLEYLSIATVLYHLIKNELFKKIILYSFIPFILYAIFDYFLLETGQYNNYINLLSAFLLIIYIIYFFYEKMKTVVMYPLYQSASFWLCVGFFLYFTGTFFFFLFVKSIGDKKFIQQMNIIYGFVTVAKNILLCLSLFATENIEQSDEELHIPSDLNLDEFSLTTQKNS